MFSSTQLRTRLRHMLDAPLRWPRTTTRRLMILVALVAVGLWAVMNVPRAIEQSIHFQEMAEYQAELERRSSETERESSTRASVIQSQFDAWRQAAQSADEMTERYFKSRRQFYDTDAQYRRDMAAYHANLKNHYRWARWFPLSSHTPNSAQPRVPVQHQPPAPEPGKKYAIIMEGAIAAAFSPSGTGLAVACRDKTIRMLELPSRRVLTSCPLPERDAFSVAFSPDGTTLFAIGDGRFVRSWKMATGQADWPIAWSDQSPGQGVPRDFATAIACSPDGGTIAVAVDLNTGGFSKGAYAVRLLDTRTGQRKWEYKGTGSQTLSVAYSPDGQTLACGSGAALLLNTRTGKLTRTLKPAIGHVVGVAFSPDGRILAGAGADTQSLGVQAEGNGRVTMWDVSTGEIRRTLKGTTEHMFEVAFSPDGRTIAAGGRGSSKMSQDRFSGLRVSKKSSVVRLWDVATGGLVWTAEGESNSASSLSFSADGKWLAFCDEDYVYIIDAGTGRLKQVVMETIVKFRVRD